MSEFTDEVKRLREELPRKIAEDIMSVDLAKDDPLRSQILKGGPIKLVIEFKDADGIVTERHEVEGQIATQEEINEALALIKGGCNAHTAMFLAKQGKP